MEVLKSKLVYTLLVIFALLLCACDEVYIHSDLKTPIFYFNADVEAGAPVSVTTHVTQPRYSNDIIEPDSAATWRLIVNDRECDTTYIVAPGDRVRIEGTSPKYGTAWSEVTVPAECPDLKMEWTARNVKAAKHIDYRDRETYTMEFDLYITLKVTDHSPAADYYQLANRQYVNIPGRGIIYPTIEEQLYSGSYRLLEGAFDTCNDPIFSEDNSLLSSMFGQLDQFDGVFFTDNSFSGSSYTLNFAFSSVAVMVYKPAYLEEREIGFEVDVEHISESTYKWANYLAKSSGIMGNISGAGLAPPLVSYSNVSCGAGVTRARTPNRLHIPLSAFILEYISKIDK